MANTDIVTREDIGNGLAINANKLEADFTKVASKNDLLTKADLVNGKVPASQLPSFIDEIQEYPSLATFPISGQSDILYLALDTNKLYRWSGTAYVDLSALAGMPDFALNANVVHKTLDETIDGIKSFNSPIYAQDGLSLKNNNAPLLQTGRTILYANASQFGFLNGNDKGAIFMYNNPNSLVYVLPSETGTLALLSDLAPYLTIATASSTYQTLANLSQNLNASASKYPSVDAVNAGLATKYNNPTGTVSQYIRGDGSIANFPFIPTLIWGNIGGTLANQTDLQSALDGKFNNPTGTTNQYVRGDGSIATFPAPYGLLPTGGEAGQILTKVDGTDYNTAWMDNYALWTSVVRHDVKAGEALNKGQAVYISPIQDGTNMIVVKADYSQESTSSKTLGLMMQSLSNNGFGQVVTEGLLGNLNTIGANQGDPVWLGANGSLIYGLGNKPEAPNHLVFIGIVTRVNANNGEIFVKVQNGFELEELHNVKIVNKANNEVLAYEQSTGLWKNKAINDLIGYVPANDNNVAHLSGNETVGGNKTFTGATAIAGLFIDETFGYANIADHTQLKVNPDYFHFNASSNNKGAKFTYGTAGQRVYGLPITDGILALTSDIPTLGSLGGVPATRTISINGTTYDLSANRVWNLSASEIAVALGYTPLAVESDPIFVASPAYGITSLLIGNWNTAYGWGNHAGLYSLLGHTHTFASLTSKPTTLAGYGITDSATSAQGANADTAYGWGNHANAGYLLASVASTLYQSKDADLTAIAGLAGATGLLRKTALDNWALDTNAYLTGITSGQVIGALGYTPVPTTRTITINGTAYDLSADRAWTIASGVTSFNTRTGAIVLSSADVTVALGFTPYNATNPNGYISGITSAMVTGALGYTPYNSSNPSGYISGITSLMVTNALGYTPYNSSNPAGYITASALAPYLPLSGGNMTGNLRLVSISGNDQMVENTYGAYLHLGGWAVGRTDATAVLVNTAYRADYADALFDMNISRFTNNSGYVTSSGSVNYASSAGSASQVTVNYSNDSNSTYQMLWGSGNSVYGTGGVYVNPYYDYLYATAFISNGFIRISANNNLYLDNNYGQSIVGVYTSTRYQGIFAMGDSYKLAIDGSTPGNLYGLAWSHPNAGGVASNLNTHGLLVMENGTFLAAISGNIKARDGIIAGSYMFAPNYIETNGPIYATIMYDNNDRSYYVDPHSTSNLYKLSAGTLSRNNLNRMHTNSPWDTRANQSAPYQNGSMGWGQTDFNVMTNWGSGFTDSWSNPANAPGGSSHYVGFQSMHHSSENSYNFYGFQMTCAGEADNRFFWRSSWNTPRSWVEMIHSGNNTWSNLSGKPSNVFQYPGWGNWDANTIPENYSSFSYSNSCPWTGPLTHFSAGGYGLQLNANYGGGTGISYRTRNGDAGSWNSWYRLYSDTYRPYADSCGNADTVDGYHMNQAVTVNASPTFQEVYANGWFRSTGYSGHYNPTNGAHWYPNDNSYGTWKIQGSRNGWGGHVTNHNYILSLMLNTSGDYGFLTENGNWWNLFYNNGNNCWGIGTDNTYSGDGFRCIKYGSSQYGWTTWSDRRAKENIKGITNALDTVLSMRGVYFNYINDEAKNKRVGFIAQELEQVLPEAVRYAEEIDEYNVEYAQIVSVLTEAIKEQNAIILDQGTQINELKLLVNQLINK